MKIAFFTDVFLPRIDGVSNSVYHLSRRMAADGHQVMIFAPKLNGSENVEVEGVDVEFLPSIPAFVYPDTRIGLLSPKLFKKINDFQADIIHVTAPATLGLMGLMFSRNQEVPAVGAFHGYFMTPEYLEIVGIKKLTKPFEKMLWRIARDFYNKCDLVITPSEYVKQDLLSHGFETPITVINNAVDIDADDADDRLLKKFKNKHQIQDINTILYVGRISVEKNLKQLLEVFKQIKDKQADSQLVVIGTGPQLQELKDYAEVLNIANGVIFTGSVDHDFLIKAGLYRLGDVFVTCSTSEVQPMSIIEAMNFGMPIVAAKARGVEEMVDRNGYLIKPGKIGQMAGKIAKILSSQELQQKLGKSSQQRAKKYDLVNVAQQHVQTYQDMIAS